MTKASLTQSPINSIVVFRALQLGDMLCSIPAFRSLRHAFPQAEITLVGLPWAKEFATHFSDYIDDFIYFPGYPGLPETPEFSAQDVRSFLANVQSKEFDLAIQLHGSGEQTNPLVSLFGAKTTAGFYTSGNFCPNPYTFLPYPTNQHEIHRLLSLLRFLGIESQGDTLEFPLTNKEQTDIIDFLKQKHIIKPFIVVHAGAVSGKRWSEENFAQVADYFSQQGYQIVLTGTEKEQGITNRVKELMTADCIDLTGKTDLTLLAGILKHSSLLISNDTGVAHLAVATETPSVTIFTSADPNRWASLDQRLHPIVLSTNATIKDVIIRAQKQLSKHQSHPYYL